MPPIGAAPRCSPASSPVFPVSVDFIDTGPTIKRRLRSFLGRDPPPDRHAAYLESVGYEHSACRSSPVSPPVRVLPRVSVPSIISSTSSSPRLYTEPLRRPGVALSLSVSTESLAVAPASSPTPSSLASRASSFRGTPALPPLEPAPNCPLPPLPVPASPHPSLESVVDANILHRCATTFRVSSSEPAATATTTYYAPLHERIFRRSKGLLSGAIGSIWSLPSGQEEEEEYDDDDDEDGVRSGGRGLDDETLKRAARGRMSKLDGTKISLDDLSLSPELGDGGVTTTADEEDLLAADADERAAGVTMSPDHHCDGEPGRPSLSASSSSDSTDRIKFSSSVFDSKPNLMTTTTTSNSLFPPLTAARLNPSGSPSISPRTHATARFEPRLEPAPRQFRRKVDDDDDDDEEDDESDIDVVRKTPGAFCWTLTEHLTLSSAEQERLATLLRTKSW